MSRSRNRTLAALTALAVGVLGLVIATAQPAAAERLCTGTIGAQTIGDDVRVPAGAACTLDGTVVEGNVLVGPGARLTVTGATIDGNIQDDDASAGHVAVTAARIGGNIQLEQGTSATVADTAIGGDLQLESNSGQLRATGNTIDGNLQANQNTGGLTIVDNRITGNLQCQSNAPAPTGSGNVVQGSAEGQCATLTGATAEPPTTTARPTSRIAGADRYATAVQISRTAFPNGAPTVYLANGTRSADALAGKSLTDGPILLVPGCGDVPGTVLAEIRRLDPTRVVALGGTGAICDQVLAAAGNA
jgi:hypothetical protein